MADEFLKVNEFETGEKRYVAPASFQRKHGPESNFHYRAHSADEILNNIGKLKEMIKNHIEVQCPRLADLDNYTKARNTGIYNIDDRRVEAGKADYRAAHNFAKLINIFDVGYNTGVPIKKESSDEKISEIIKEYDIENDAEALDSELWHDMKKYGRAYELQYRNKDDKNRSVISSVFDTFVCYSLEVERTPLFGVRYPKYRTGKEVKCVVSVYTDKEVITYKPCSLNALKLVEEKRETHEWGEVPITEYSPDRYRQGGYEDVIPLIDLYDAAQSDTANYMTDLNEATLVISGDLDLNKYTTAELIAMKNANMLLLANGVNPDGSKSQTDAGYIYKQYDVNGAEAYKNRIRTDIHEISLVPDLTDESFSGAQSGEAMKYKLFGFQQICKTSQRGFAKGLMRRYRLLLNIKQYVREAADNIDLDDLVVTFTPNLPKAILDELKTIIDAGGELSQETILSLASFIDDVKAEIERVKEEKEEARNSTPIIQSMFSSINNGDNDDGSEQ